MAMGAAIVVVFYMCASYYKYQRDMAAYYAPIQVEVTEYEI